MNQKLSSKLKGMAWLQALCCLGAAPLAVQAAPAVSQQIIVNQIGYRVNSPKVAIVANPYMGFNKDSVFIPGDSIVVRKVSDDSRVMAVALAQWNGGKPDTTTKTIGIYNNNLGKNVDTTVVTAMSGDRTWWADFSDLKTPGDYYLYDAKNDRKSFDFKIGEGIYDKVLEAAVKMFYYQRQGMDKDPKHAGVWNHKADHLQDSVATTWMGDSAKRDMRGGWWDAGDLNKYMPYTTRPIWQLLDAFENNAQAFSDATNIPESGNGVPDILDEIKWELDWMLRMQNRDGSVHSRVADEEGTKYPGVGGPEAVKNKRHYTLASTWSSACFAAGVANASRFFKLYQAAYPGYSDTLLARARLAWSYLEAKPTRFPVDGWDGMKMRDGKVDKRASGSKEYEEGGRLLAAAELFRATGEKKFQTYFDTKMFKPILGGYLVINPMGGDYGWVGQMALVAYARTPGATQSKVDTIKSAFREINNWFSSTPEVTSKLARAYRVDNWHYSWGSNETMSNWGLTSVYARKLGVVEDAGEDLMAKGEEYVHYMLGRNPMNLVYLTNLGKKGLDLGVERGVTSMFHTWTMKKKGWTHFDYDSSLYGQPPGYVTGGPNFNYTYNTSNGILQELRWQPHMKSYKDWSGDWPENSWEISEPAIYYQGAFVNLLSNFATGAGTTPTTGIALASKAVAPKLHASLNAGVLKVHGVDVAQAELLDASGRVAARLEIRGGKAAVGALRPGVHVLRVKQGESVQSLTLSTVR
jgi:endoglucanase